MKRSIVLRWVILSASLATATVLTFDGGDPTVPLRLLESTRDAAAIVFGASGIWISLLYPEALKAAMTAPESIRGLTDRLRFALAPLILSAIVTISSIVTPVVFERFVAQMDAGRSTSVAATLWWILSFNTCAIVGAVLLALGPGQWLHADVNRVSSRHSTVRSLLSLTQAGPKRSERRRINRDDS